MRGVGQVKWDAASSVMTSGINKERHATHTAFSQKNASLEMDRGGGEEGEVLSTPIGLIGRYERAALCTNQ